MENHTDSKAAKKGYGKFVITLIISFIVMYLTMYLNLDRAEHYHTSVTRLYMALLSPMAIVMMLMMGKMYPSRSVNAIIIGAAVVVFALALTGLRTQTPIGDIQYMKAMIPHHSSAIMVSRRADIRDPGVKELSRQIIRSQEREIATMEKMLATGKVVGKPWLLRLLFLRLL